jgi:Mor family transcriptional regulator
MSGKLDWVRETGIEDLLDNDLKLVYEWCGLDVVLSLLEHFASMTIYVSTKPLNEAKKRYIRTHYNGRNVKELCSLLSVSERFVYEAVGEARAIEGQEGLW